MDAMNLTTGVALLPTLGAIEELVLGVIMVIVLVGSWVANRVKEQQEESAREQRGLRRGSSGEAKVDLDEVAAQRREQLRQMARQRMQQGGRGASASQGGAASGGGGQDLSSLSMAERIARARAAGRGESADQSPDLRQSGWEDQQAEARRRAEQREQERRRREQEERREVQRRERAEAERRRQTEARRREREQQAQQRARQQRRQAQQRQARQQRQTQQVTARRQEAIAPITDEGGARQSRGQVSRATKPGPRVWGARTAGGPSAHLMAMLHGPGLRDAMVLKEILDRPIALREPANDPWA